MSYILIVDDIENNIKVLKILLSKEHYELKTATDGIEALMLINQSPPELILLDIIMPHMDGIELCKKVKKNPATHDIPIIFLTAHLDDKIKENAFAAGAQDYITKPFHKGETLARVRNQLKIRQSFKELQQYHKQEKQHLENILQIQRDFIESTTHDLKNPLAIIFTSVHLIQKFGSGDWNKILNYLKDIERSAKIMKNLVNDVLNLARIEAEVPNTQAINLSNTIQEVIADIKPLAKRKHISLKFTTLPLDLFAQVDPSHCKQILLNILSNAIKYSPIDTTINVRLGRDTDPGFLKITIHDQGYGIPKSDLGKIFNRFYRSDIDSHLREEGTGLGLYVVKTLTERNKGSIQVGSEMGIGTKFTIRFTTYFHQPANMGKT